MSGTSAQIRGLWAGSAGAGSEVNTDKRATAERVVFFMEIGAENGGTAKRGERPRSLTGAEAVKCGAMRRNYGGKGVADIVLSEARPEIPDGDAAG